MNPPVAAPQTTPSPLKAVAATFAVGIGGSAIAVVAFLAAVRAMRQYHAGGVWVFAVALVYGAVILGVAYTAARAGQRYGCATPTPAALRYRRRFMTSMAAYVFTLLAATGVFVLAHPAPWLEWLLALAPSAPIVATIVVMGLYLREETDELERAITAEAALWATGGLLAVATTWGFLEQFDLVVHAPAWIAFVVWAICLGPATAFVRARYQ